MELSNNVSFFILRRGFGVVFVKGATLLPKPAHKIKPVDILILVFSFLECNCLIKC